MTLIYWRDVLWVIVVDLWHLYLSDYTLILYKNLILVLESVVKRGNLSNLLIMSSAFLESQNYQSLETSLTRLWFEPEWKTDAQLI